MNSRSQSPLSSRRPHGDLLLADPELRLLDELEALQAEGERVGLVAAGHRLELGLQLLRPGVVDVLAGREHPAHEPAVLQPGRREGHRHGDHVRHLARGVDQIPQLGAARRARGHQPLLAGRSGLPEVEDAVRPRALAGRDRHPCRGAVRRQARLEAAVAAPLQRPRQVRHHAPLGERAEQIPRRAVQTEDDDLSGQVSSHRRRSVPPGRRRPRHPVLRHPLQIWATGGKIVVVAGVT